MRLYKHLSIKERESILKLSQKGKGFERSAASWDEALARSAGK